MCETEVKDSERGKRIQQLELFDKDEIKQEVVEIKKVNKAYDNYKKLKGGK